MTVFEEPDLYQVTADEAQVLRVFALAPGSAAEAAMSKAAEAGGVELAETAGKYLGGATLDGAWLELLNQKDVETMGGIEAYLVAGYDPPEQALDLLRPALEDAPRYLLLVLSRAFLEKPVRLTPGPGLAALAAASLLRAPPTASPLPAEDPAEIPKEAEPPENPPMSQGRISGMVALAALLVAGALVVAMVVIAG